MNFRTWLSARGLDSKKVTGDRRQALYAEYAAAAKAKGTVRIRASDVLVTAAAGDDGEPKRPTIHIRAYDGMPMKVRYWGDVVIDLSGLKIDNPTRLAANHADSVEGIIGQGEARATENGIEIDGELSAATEAGRSVIGLGKDKVRLQASVGVQPLRWTELSEGQTYKANGHTHTAGRLGLIAFQQSELIETSVVTRGADADTSVDIAAHAALSTEGDDTMEFSDWLKAKGFDEDALTEEQTKVLRAAYDAEQKTEADDAGEPQPVKVADDPVAEMRAKAAAEKKRIGAVQLLAAKYGSRAKPDKCAAIEAKAIEEGWDVKQTELELLKAELPEAPAVHTGGVSNTVRAQAIEAALARTMGMEQSKLEKDYGDEVMSAADKEYRLLIGPGEFVLEMARAGGFVGNRIHGGNFETALRAAFSTQGAQSILSNVANKVLLDAYMAVESAWREVSEIRPVKDFKQVTHYRLTGDMTYQQLAPDGHIQHASTDEETFTNQADTYARILSITRKDIINDDLGAFSSLRQSMGRGAALKLNDVFWTAFLDNSTFFTGARSNYASGAATALDSTALSTAVQMFRDQVDANSKPLALTPKVLLVPTALEATADELYVSRNINTGGSSTKNKVPDANTHGGKYRPVVSAYLGNSSYTGYSATAWYLIADPREMAVMEVLFLDGKETPTVEASDVDFDRLGIQVRGYHDFGCAKAEYRAGVKLAGA